MDFQTKLIELRKQKGWSQEGLGDMIGVTRQTISKWELGTSVPDLNMLVKISELFHISLDELTGNKEVKETVNYDYVIRPTYEYKSKKQLFGLPLVHINIGWGFRKAKGIIAIGNIATGFLSIGGVSMGILSLGALSTGLLSIGGISLALLIAFGGLAIGTVAVGGAAFGVFAVGGAAIGVYSLGGLAVGSRIAAGGFARGYIAIGDKTYGIITFNINNPITPSEIKNAIQAAFPSTWKVIVDIFSSLV